jgi:hypothetical protein
MKQALQIHLLITKDLLFAEARRFARDRSQDRYSYHNFDLHQHLLAQYQREIEHLNELIADIT